MRRSSALPDVLAMILSRFGIDRTHAQPHAPDVFMSCEADKKYEQSH